MARPAHEIRKQGGIAHPQIIPAKQNIIPTIVIVSASPLMWYGYIIGYFILIVKYFFGK